MRYKKIIAYRPEIDGLRAIAVVAVILYHPQINLYGHNFFTGGFIGVDIFFVISGYLITSLILKELKRENNFSFLHFYERRARRILPALLVVMIASLPFAWMYLLPINFVDFSKSILYSLGFSSNFYFHYSGLQYGAEDGLLKPFLHTWTLSVEEQFYILFPIILFITHKYFKNHILIIMGIGLIVSLTMADWGSKHYSSATFYFLPSRMWELLSGSILAYLEIQRKERSSFKLLNQFLPTFGILLIGHSIVFYNDKMFHPSFYTLSPIIGVCLIIWFSHKDELITKILSSKLFVGIGLISYSLYLWHYPILVFDRITEFSLNSLILKGFLGVLMISLSILTYYIIEKPFRNKKIINKNFLFIIIIPLLMFLIYFNLSIIKKQGVIERMPEIIQNTIKQSDYRQIGVNKESCHNRFGNKGFCVFNFENKTKGDIILLGDSIIDALLSDLIKQSYRKNYRLIHMSYSGNLFLPEFVRVQKNTNKIITDERIHIVRKDTILASHNNTYIVVIGNYPYYFYENRPKKSGEYIGTYDTNNYYSHKDNLELNKELRIKKLKNHFKKTLIELANKNKKIILLYPLPEPLENISKAIYKLTFKKNHENKLKKLNLSIKYKYFLERNREIFNLFDEINHKNIYKIYPHKLFCNNQSNECIFHNKKDILFFDIIHPSLKGAEMINGLIMKEIERAEATKN